MNTDSNGCPSPRPSPIRLAALARRRSGWERVSAGRVRGFPSRPFTKLASPLPALSVSIRVHPWINFSVDTLKFKLIIAYDGTGYEGWQVQKTGTGVQEKVEAALAKLFPSKPRVHSSSRTDTGVHALGMVAHFEMPRAECKMTAAQTGAGAQRLAAGGHPRAVRRARAERLSRAFRCRRQAVSLFRLESSGDESAAPPHAPGTCRVRSICAAMRAGREAVRRQTRFQILRRQPQLRNGIHRPHADALRPQTQRARCSRSSSKATGFSTKCAAASSARWCRSGWANFRRRKSSGCWRRRTGAWPA